MYCRFALLVLAAGLATGSEDKTPLAETRKELRELRRSQTVGTEPAAKDGLRTSVLPSIQAPSATEPVLPPFRPGQSERELKAKSDAQRNWLLNGVRKLEAKSNTDGMKDQLTEAELEEEAAGLDPHSPAFLVELYEKQREAERAKEEQSARKGVPAADPFAPFLQGWLAGSRGSHGLADGRGIGNTDSPALPQRGEVQGASIPSSDLLVNRPQVFGGNASISAAPNPYLAALAPVSTGGNSLPPAGSNAVSGLPLAIPVTPMPAAHSSQSTGSAVAAPAAAPKALPPSPREEDKRYFPQLNRF